MQSQNYTHLWNLKRKNTFLHKFKTSLNTVLRLLIGIYIDLLRLIE